MKRMGLVTAGESQLIGEYEDFWSFVMDAQHPADHQHPNQASYHKEWMRKSRGSWYGLEEDANFEGVKQIVLDGWPDGLRAMEAALGSLAIDLPPVSIRRRRERSDFGDELDIHRIYSGDFARAFTSMKRLPGTKRKAFQIVVDSIASGDRAADEMFWQGAAAIKLGELLSNAGYTVELYSAFKAQVEQGSVTVRVMTKGSGTPLDLCSAAATLALPAFFRCVGHAWIHANLATSHESSGVSVRRLSAADGDFVAGQNIKNSALAVEWIQSQVARMQSAPCEQEQLAGVEDDDDIAF